MSPKRRTLWYSVYYEDGAEMGLMVRVEVHVTTFSSMLLQCKIF